MKADSCILLATSPEQTEQIMPVPTRDRNSDQRPSPDLGDTGERPEGNLPPASRQAEVSAFMVALTDLDAKVRKEAAYSLAEIGREAKTAVQALVERLGDEDAGVRAAAACALQMIGPD